MFRRFLILFGMTLALSGLPSVADDSINNTTAASTVDPQDINNAVDVQLSNTDPIVDRSSHYHHLPEVHHHHEPSYHGFWKKKFVWRPRWVKTWQEKKVYVAVWKRMWGPAILNEWVPIPKPPPGWYKPSVGGYVVQNNHH